MGLELPVKPDGSFSRFAIDSIVDNSVTDFDLFINIDKHFILYSGNGYVWNRDELTELLQSGHDEFFIRRTDVPKAQMYATVSRLPKINNDLPPPDRIKSIEQVGAAFIKALYEGELTEACVAKAEDVGRSMVECVAEDNSCIKYLSGLADHDYYTYYHSIRVASYATAVAIECGLTDMRLLQEIALGGILHDIGKKEVPLGLLNKTGALTENEWKVMKHHPVFGHNAIKDSIESHVPREIILHHHEKLNGSGYPHGLDKGNLIYEVQIAQLADIFDALTSSRSYQRRRTKFEALDFIKHRLLKEEVCQDAFKALVMCLAR